ncbi:MAG TPA: response regulator [Polyangiaceae bacterium]
MAGQRHDLKPPSGEMRAGAPVRVLVVDDDPRMTQTITRILCRHHEVTAVDRASAAFELVRNGARFDVILCDVNMPGMTGVDLFRDLERLSPEVAARIVFLTAGVFTPSVGEFLASVDNVRLEKPFRLEELERVVAALASRAPQR